VQPRKFLASLAFILVAALSAPAPAATNVPVPAPISSEAGQVIDQFHASLIGVMKDGTQLGYRGRYEALAPIIARTFNLAQMAQLSVGPYWSKLDQTQRDALVEAFTRLTVATYANRFDHFSGQAFRVTGEPQPRGEALMVTSELKRSSGEIIPITYYMRRFDAGWQTVDVFLKGAISEMATKRAEYSSVLQRQGLDGLIRVIDEKAKSYAGA
jgi:phospholipid transport system substrate-binding protein